MYSGKSSEFAAFWIKINLQRRKATFYNNIMDLYSLLFLQHLQYKFQQVSLLWSHISDRKVAVSSVDNFSLCIYFSSHKIDPTPSSI